MLPTFAVCFWATTALAACSTRTRVHYVRADDRSRRGDPYYPENYYPERLQSRASSIFGPSIQTSAAGFPYRFVFPANHPALSGSMYSQFVQNPHQPEPAAYSAEDLFGPQPTAKQHPLSDLKHRQHQQQQQQQNQHQQQQQQIGYESMAKMQYDFLGGGGGGKIQAQQQPSAAYHHHLIKQPKHYQSYELAPNALQQPLHQSPYPSSPSIGQPIMLLIPSSGQPGAPYQTLVLVPSSGSPSPLPAPVPLFPGFHQQVQHQHGPPGQQFVQQSGGFVTTHPRGPPLVAGFPSGLGGGGFGGGLGLSGNGVSGLGKFPGAQLFHRSHETLPKHPNHQQHQHKASSSSSSIPLLQPTSYQGSGSTHVSHTTAAGSAAQQPLEDKVGHGTGTSGEKSDDRDDDGSDGGSGSGETKSEEKSPEFGDKTTVRPIKPIKRIVVT